MKKNKIGLVTIHRANNYGAFLQTFATQEVLKKYGDVEIVDYVNKKLESSFDLIRYNGFNIKSIMGATKDILRLVPRVKVINSFIEDINCKYNLSERVNHCDLYEYAKNKEYTHVFCGSDQIWNPVCVSVDNNLNDYYLLNFISDDTLKISYASSMGDYKLDVYNSNIIFNELSTFDAISVREKERKNEINKITGKDVVHVLDPTLLLNRSDWLERFCNISSRVKKLSKNKYILFYSVPKVSKTRELLSKVYSLLGFDIISIDQDIYPYYKANHKVRDCSIEEFIHLFNNASFVVTDSFHGVCFSIIFRKSFYTTSPGKLSNRIVSLLETLGLESRIINDILNLTSISHVDYDTKLELKIKNEISKSKKFIEKAITTNG
ncbi:hypothetical protein GNP61_00355 [Aliivibrio fischeri]|uniref:polysaccharide pyruvyl transferase family protein n=1 Tax=Aliivibrio fischeri TaxID=668 RepID=UPI0012DA6EDC|nr:polysaccharide pyruvyl transferase family protein [Aliivibrio fischeri]MUK40001.1 hypothetical protein [Aliivibrio fischeri]